MSLKLYTFSDKNIMKEIDWSFIHGEGTIECYCDQCDDNYSYEFVDGDVDFKACQQELKSLGWISRQIDGEWHDFCCADCYNEYLKQHK